MKKSITLLLESAVVLTGVLLADSRPAHAYLDPGTGSYALQVTIAGVFGALFSVKMFWSNIVAAIRRIAGVPARKPAAAAAAASQTNSSTPS